MNKKFITIAGYGSIGKKYAAFLKNKNYYVIVFDPKFPNNKVQKKITYLNDYASLSNQIKNKNIKTGIISSLANTQYKNFNFFVKNGINKILIEKPVTNNFSEFRKILNFKKKNFFISTHFKWSALGLHKLIKKIEVDQKLGKPFQFNSFGGANCLATGGMHWIDFFIRHFKINDNNIDISSSLNLDKINPRDKSFYNIGGTVLLNCKNKGSGVLSFNNCSRLAPLQSLIYKSHLLEFDIAGNYRLYRTHKKLDKLKITRYGIPELKKKGNFFKKKDDSLNLVVLNLLYKNKPLISLDKSAKVFKILVAILISNKKKSSINFNNIENIIKKEKFYNKNLRFT